MRTGISTTGIVAKVEINSMKHVIPSLAPMAEGYNRPDERIQDDVCDLLTRDRGLDTSEMDVNVENGVVTLTGKVEDRSMKRYAGRLIENISGVKDVQNLLEFDRQ